MNKRLIFFTLFAVVSIGLLAAFQPFSSSVSVETAVSQTAPLAPAAQIGGVVTAEGRVEPLFFSDLSFQTGGVVTEILVSEGDIVSAGDPLVRLESTDFEISLQQAQARLTSAQASLSAAQNQLALAQAGVDTAQSNVTAAVANLALTTAGPLPEEIAEAESNLSVAEASVVQASGTRSASLNGVTASQIQSAEANLASVTADLRAIEDNYEAILDSCFELPNGDEVCPLFGPVEESTRTQLEIAQANQIAAQAQLDALRRGPTAAQRSLADSGVVLAEANLLLSQAQLDLLLAGPTPEQIAVAEVAVQQAEVGVQIAEVGVAQAEAAVTQAEAGVETAQATVDSAQAALVRLTLTATFDGEVSRISTNVGELVGGGLPVVTMADFGEWHVQTIDLTELDIAAVEVGDSVEVTFDAIRNTAVSGEVIDIALMSTLSRGDVVYEVTIRMDADSDLPVRWGMTAFVDIDTN
ncbi:MAG: HlyD family efflux transporter periplasmic adaptor subunit [Chloroflexota bacterium]